MKPDESLAVERCSPKLGFGTEQGVNRSIAIHPVPSMRHTAPRAGYAARTAQINAKLARRGRKSSFPESKKPNR